MNLLNKKYKTNSSLNKSPITSTLSNKKILQKYKFLIIKFINLLMIDGKKSKSEKIFFSILKFLSSKDKKFPFSIFFLALKNISPLVTIRSIRVKGRSYQVPIPLKESKQIIIGMKWLIQICRNTKITKNNSFIDILNQQIFLAFQKKGDLIKKKYELHKIAKANRLFANFRWF